MPPATEIVWRGATTASFVKARMCWVCTIPVRSCGGIAPRQRAAARTALPHLEDSRWLGIPMECVTPVCFRRQLPGPTRKNGCDLFHARDCKGRVAAHMMAAHF